VRTIGEPASITGWSTAAAACDRPAGLPLKIRGCWENTLAMWSLRLLRSLGRPFSVSAGSLGLPLLVLFALSDGLGILVLHVAGTAAGDAAPLLRAGKVPIRTTLVATTALVAIVPAGAAPLGTALIVGPRPLAASLALGTARLVALTAALRRATTTWLVARAR
jgi:hypothetical protein